MAAPLPLRDVHLPPAPSWWPPAPGWWLLAAALLIVAALAWFWRRRRARRRAAIELVFDQAVAAADTPSAQVAAISELLRRAARRCDPQADRLQGEAWLEFLDRGSRTRDFAEGEGRVLLDGAFRREVEPARVAALRGLARRRFLQWMGAAP